LQAATPSPLSAVDIDAVLEDAVLPPPSLPATPAPAAVPLDGVMAPAAALPALAAAPPRGRMQRTAGIAPGDPPQPSSRAPDTQPSPPRVEPSPSPERAGVAMARTADVVREPRTTPAAARAAPGSVVQVSPAAPNRAAVYVAHPVPVTAWPPRPPRTLVTYAE
jgi:hypothetical protein